MSKCEHTLKAVWCSFLTINAKYKPSWFTFFKMRITLLSVQRAVIINLNIFKEIKKPKSCITLRYTTSGIREHEGNVEDTSRSRVLSTFLAFLVLSFYTWIAWVLLKKRLYNASAKPLQFILVKVIV